MNISWSHSRLAVRTWVCTTPRSSAACMQILISVVTCHQLQATALTRNQCYHHYHMPLITTAPSQGLPDDGPATARCTMAAEMLGRSALSSSAAQPMVPVQSQYWLLQPASHEQQVLDIMVYPSCRPPRLIACMHEYACMKNRSAQVYATGCACTCTVKAH